MVQDSSLQPPANSYIILQALKTALDYDLFGISILQELFY
jgi:hypothetical protein